MIGCLILGTFAVMAFARAIHHRHRCASPFGGHGHWHGGFSGACCATPRLRYFARHFHGGDGRHEGYGAGDWDYGHHGATEQGVSGFLLRSILGGVRATATQEKVIRAAVDEFQHEMKDVGAGEGKKTRQDLGAALRKPHFDEVFMGELFARQDDTIEKGRKAFVGLMAKVHDVLDEEQRGRLADLVEKGPRFWRRHTGW